ncbi:MAG: phospholipid carrier-dependent glycosyltransferase [Desulfobacula sp.]|jgi:hypothetical protein
MIFSLNQKISRINTLYAMLIVGSVICISLLSSVPPVNRDALTHHLFIPKLYLQHGGMYEIQYLPVSYYPMNIDLLYLIPLYFNNDTIPAFIHFSFALITSLMIYRYLLGRINKTYALLGALFFLTIPVIVRLSSTAYVDLGLIFFLFVSILCLFDWIESGFKIRYLIFSGICCGLAVGAKYNGLIGMFLLGLFIIFVYARYHARRKYFSVKAVGCGAVFVVTAGIVFSPWVIRNIAWTGNPVYPLYNSLFQNIDTNVEAKPDTEPEEYTNISHIRVLREIYGESWLQIALIPLRVFFQGQDDNPQYFDGKTNPFLLLLTLFAFFGIRSGTPQEKTEKLLMMFFSVLFLIYACAQASIRIRYFSAILPLLVILAMFGLFNIQTQILNRSLHLSEQFKKTIIFGIIITMLGLNANYLVNRFKIDQPISYLLGYVTRDEYIQRYRPEYATYQFANENLAQDSKILGVYIGNRGYYSDRHIEFSTEILRSLASNSKGDRYIAEKLKGKGFTHILINFDLFNTWAQKYTDHEKKNLDHFFKVYTTLEFLKDGHGLLRLIMENE